jgi:predicted small metal-binding protein
MPLIVTTSIINKKTYLMTFIAWAIIITDVIFGTFLDVLGKPLNSSFGVILFITMSITVFFAGLYALRDYMVALRKNLEAPSFFNRLYKATPIFLYALLVIFGAIIVEMVLFSQYSTYLLILIVLISAVAILFFGFRTYKFLSWFKSSVNKRHNIMILAFAVSSMLLCISTTVAIALDIKELVVSRPPSIDPHFHSSNSMASRHLSRIELVIHLYGFLVPQVTAIAIAETVAVAYFLRYFKDQIGRATFWTLIILPPILFLTGIFGPQLLTTGSQFVYMEPRFLIFRVLGTAGWVGADLVIAYAYILVAKSLGRQITSSRNKIINYLIIAALSTILVSPTTNNWITNNSYPPFGAIQRAFVVLASFLFSIGIYSVALSVAQDAELRHLARKYAKEYALLGTLGKAKDNAEIMRKIVKHIHQHADAMEKETAVESSMLDDNEVRQYIDLAIRETGGKKDDRTVGA